MLSNTEIRLKITDISLKISILIIFLYVFIRSYSVGFTHDESLSYAILTGNDSQLFTANNHWLNTILMKLCSLTFGYSAWSLRLPNVLAFILYACSVYQLLQQLRLHFLAIWMSIFVFFLNPFLIDFFSLARGYGLGMAFLTFALYRGILYFKTNQSTKNWVFFSLSALACIYSNYAFFTPILALHFTFLIIHLKMHRLRWKILVVFYLLEICLLVPAILNINYLSKKNELYAGGENNVFQDTLKSIFHFSYDTDWFDFTFGGITVFTGILLLSLLKIKTKNIQFLLAWIFALLAIPTVLHWVIHMGFAKDRAAIYWILIGGLMTILTLNEFLQTPKNKLGTISLLVLCSILACIQGIVFWFNINFHHSMIWKSDSDVKAALKTIEKLATKKGSIHLGISWTLEPSINYYRETNSMTWLKPVSRDGISGVYDYYLFFDEDASEFNQKNSRIVQRFSDNKLTLRQSK